MKKRRSMMTIGVLMILVAVCAVIFWVIEDRRRIRVQFTNHSMDGIQNLRVAHGGRVEDLGTVSPRRQIETRIAFQPKTPVRISFDQLDASGKVSKHVEFPGVIASAAGGTITVGFGLP